MDTKFVHHAFSGDDHHMGIWDHEENARAIYGMADIAPDERPSMHALAKRLPGVRSVKYKPGMEKHGKLIRVAPDEFEIWVLRGLRRDERRLVIAEECGEFLFYDVIDDLKEIAMRELAKFLVSPLQIVLEFSRGTPPDIEEMARVTGLSQRDAAARAAVARQWPVAVITRSEVLTAGPPWGWPSEAALRALPVGASRLLHVVEATDESGVRFVWVRE